MQLCKGPKGPKGPGSQNYRNEEERRTLRREVRHETGGPQSQGWEREECEITMGLEKGWRLENWMRKESL